LICIQNVEALPTPEGSLMVCLRELLSHGMQCSWGIASMEWEVRWLSFLN
jgi:hypothetical protein